MVVHKNIRSRLVALPAALMLALLGMFIPTVAHAQLGDLTCQAAFQFTFDPPLSATNPEENPHADAALTGCMSLNGRYSDLNSGTVDVFGTATLSSFPVHPCGLLLTITGTGNIHWSNQQTSHLTFTINTDPTNGTISLSADIQTGPLTGDTATAAPVVPIINLDCPLVGLRTLGASLAVVNFA